MALIASDLVGLGLWNALADKLATDSALYGAKASANTWTAAQTLADVNIVLGTTTGTKLGTAATQKLGFWGATPVVQPTVAANADVATLITALTNIGLIKNS